MKKIRELTVRQTAIQLGCTLKNVYDLLYAGRLQGAEKVGRTWRIPAEAVETPIKKSKSREENDDEKRCSSCGDGNS